MDERENHRRLGAAESVWPEGLTRELQTKPSVGSQTGLHLSQPVGTGWANLGEKKVHFKTKDGLNSSITFQVTKVKKPPRSRAQDHRE